MIKNNFQQLLEDLALENTSPHPNQKQYDKTLLDLQIHYMQELSLLKPGKLLDYGGAYGTQSAAFAKLGFKVKMLDGMPELSDPAWLKSYGVKFEDNNLEQDELQENQSDVIVFSEVIEHLNYNPVEPLRKLFKALRPGGLLLMSTPMKELAMHREACTGKYCSYAHYRDIPDAWNGYAFEDAHHHLYTKGELTQLLHEVGFSVLEVYPIRKGTHHYAVARRPDEK
jgi:2-polyprenyl-3-methyl-5-hydroxy-6-metoxy-1,4-benzoquinol methylase